MECVICKNGTTHEGSTTVTLERKGSIVVIKSVPAQICDNCGHAYLSSELSKLVMAKAEEAFKNGAELEVVKLQAA